MPLFAAYYQTPLYCTRTGSRPVSWNSRCMRGCVHLVGDPSVPDFIRLFICDSRIVSIAAIASNTARLWAPATCGETHKASDAAICVFAVNSDNVIANADIFAISSSSLICLSPTAFGSGVLRFLMLHKVSGSFDEQARIVVNVSQSHIAPQTQQSSDLTCLVVVIY